MRILSCQIHHAPDLCSPASFEKSWKYAKEVYTCFVDLEKVCNCVPRDKLWAVLLEYDVKGQLLAAIKSLYKQSEVCVLANGMKTKPFSVIVGLRQGCTLSPLLFIINTDKIDRDSSSASGVTFKECNVRRLLFVNDLAWLSSNKSDLQYALDRFFDACLDAGMKISTAKTEITCCKGTLSIALSKQVESLSSRRRSLRILESFSRVMVDRTTNCTHVLEKQVQ